MDTERINLPEGHWVDVKTVVTHRMRKVFRKAGLAIALGRDGNTTAPADLSDPEAFKAHIMAHPERWDLDAADDAFLIQGIMAWSWSEPVTREAIDDLPSAFVDTILVRLRELYAEATPETLKA